MGLASLDVCAYFAPGEYNQMKNHSPSRSLAWIAALSDLQELSGLIRGQFLKGHARPRIAFVGRSNVGKSSLINTLLGKKEAYVSKEPGKTRQIHFYLWEEGEKILADLPGYGYARASHVERERWSEFIQAYLHEDGNLEQAIVILDARHGPTELDKDAIRFLSSTGIPVNFVFSKLDTLKNQAERARRRKEAGLALKELGFDPTRAFWVSSETKDGMREFIAGLKQKQGREDDV